MAVTAEKSDTVLYYNDNCGGGWVTVPVTASHLRLNTAIDDALFTRPGYTLTGWNTAPDGSGQAVGWQPDRARRAALRAVGCSKRRRGVHLHS